METRRIFNNNLQDAEYFLQVVDANYSPGHDGNVIDLTNDGDPRQMNGELIGIRKPKARKVSLPNISNQNDVIRAAKSLFSKKTRTLYHWMYPNTPKFQLKTAVSLAWDTMGLQEKQFYISQVMGKFGYFQNSLMVNPQLGCLSQPAIPQLHFQMQEPDLSNVETNNAVTNLLQNDVVGTSWMASGTPVASTSGKKRGRPKGSKCHYHLKQHYQRKMERSGKIQGSRVDADFNDDPELKKELEQFQWTLHMADK